MTSPDGLKRLIASLPAESLKRGRAFERLCKWFLENDPIYRMKLQKVWQWDEWPGRWGADAGIDLVAETKDKQLWAIQAKAYSPETTITKADVDTFLSESAREIFSYRLIIATTDRIGSTAERTLHGQQIPAGQLLLTDLANAEVEWPTSITALGPKRSKPKTLRPHQELALYKVLKGFAEHDRGQLVMACGTGKTLTALHVAESLKAKRVLILLPSLSLLSQTVVEWSANSTQPFDFLAVCSDESVVDDDENVHSVSQLAYPVTTRPSEIAKFLKRRQPAMQVIFSTYQSSPRIAEAMNTKGILSFDLALADEAHRLAGQTSSDFATILKPDAIKAKKRLFMTATPRFFTGRIVKIAKERDLELASMDNEELFGPVLHTLSFAEAIEQKLLTDYRVAIIGVDDEAYLDMISKGSLVQTEELKAMGARTLAAHIGFAKAVKKFDIRRAISFHSRVASAKRFAETHAKVLSWMPAEDRPTEPITADYISGNMSAGMRRTRLDRFRSDQFKRSLLCNSRCLTEGIDVPNLDAVIFVDPRRSEVDIVQAVGRAIRLSPDKKIGTIVVPVFIDSGEDAEAALSSSSFKAVWAVLQALRAHDKELGEQFDELRGDLARYPGEAPKLPSKIFVDLPITINHEFGRAISVEVIKQTSSGWNAYFGLLQHFAERTGNSRVPQAHKELGYSLGAWVNSQRLNKVRLTQERVNKLESLPGWSWTPFNDRWQKNYQLLERYVAREGTAHVPVMHVESGVRLGNWIATQRVSRNRLTAERRRKLEELPGWTWDPVNDLGRETFSFSIVTSTGKEHH